MVDSVKEIARFALNALGIMALVVVAWVAVAAVFYTAFAVNGGFAP